MFWSRYGLCFCNLGPEKCPICALTATDPSVSHHHPEEPDSFIYFPRCVLSRFPSVHDKGLQTHLNAEPFPVAFDENFYLPPFPSEVAIETPWNNLLNHRAFSSINAMVPVLYYINYEFWPQFHVFGSQSYQHRSRSPWFDIHQLTDIFLTAGSWWADFCFQAKESYQFGRSSVESFSPYQDRHSRFQNYEPYTPPLPEQCLVVFLHQASFYENAKYTETLHSLYSRDSDCFGTFCDLVDKFPFEQHDLVSSLHKQGFGGAFANFNPLSAQSQFLLDRKQMAALVKASLNPISVWGTQNTQGCAGVGGSSVSTIVSPRTTWQELFIRAVRKPRGFSRLWPVRLNLQNGIGYILAPFVEGDLTQLLDEMLTSAAWNQEHNSGKVELVSGQQLLVKYIVQSFVGLAATGPVFDGLLHEVALTSAFMGKNHPYEQLLSLLEHPTCSDCHQTMPVGDALLLSCNFQGYCNSAKRANGFHHIGRLPTTATLRFHEFLDTFLQREVVCSSCKKHQKHQNPGVVATKNYLLNSMSPPFVEQYLTNEQLLPFYGHLPVVYEVHPATKKAWKKFKRNVRHTHLRGQKNRDDALCLKCYDSEFTDERDCYVPLYSGVVSELGPRGVVDLLASIRDGNQPNVGFQFSKDQCWPGLFYAVELPVYGTGIFSQRPMSRAYKSFFYDTCAPKLEHSPNLWEIDLGTVDTYVEESIRYFSVLSTPAHVDHVLPILKSPFVHSLQDTLGDLHYSPMCPFIELPSIDNHVPDRTRFDNYPSTNTAINKAINKGIIKDLQNRDLLLLKKNGYLLLSLPEVDSTHSYAMARLNLKPNSWRLSFFDRLFTWRFHDVVRREFFDRMEDLILARHYAVRTARELSGFTGTLENTPCDASEFTPATTSVLYHFGLQAVTEKRGMIEELEKCMGWNYAHNWHHHANEQYQKGQFIEAYVAPWSVENKPAGPVTAFANLDYQGVVCHVCEESAKPGLFYTHCLHGTKTNCKLVCEKCWFKWAGRTYEASNNNNIQITRWCLALLATHPLHDMLRCPQCKKEHLKDQTNAIYRNYFS